MHESFPNCESRRLTRHSNRRLDNHFNIFEGLFRNWFFIGISIIMCAGQVLIIFVGGKAFNIAPNKQTASMWGTAIVLGFISIPIGIVVRLIPDSLLEKLVPEAIKRRAQAKLPDVTVSDDTERFQNFPAEFADIRDELYWLKRFKGGRVNNLKFAMKHPKEVFLPKRSMSRQNSKQNSRSNSIKQPHTPTRENSFSSNGGGGGGGSNVGSNVSSVTPDSRQRSRSGRSRSRSNSVLGAATLMTGIVAGSVGAAGWSPIDRVGGDWQQFPQTKPAPSPLGASSTKGDDKEENSGKDS